ncbi:MAG: hypothetical protein Q9217_004513 [Psora testacea]
MRPGPSRRLKVAFPFRSKTSNANISKSRALKAGDRFVLSEDAMTPKATPGDIPHRAPQYSPGPHSSPPNPAVPTLYTTRPPIKDTLSTETSKAQDETVQQCLPYLAGTTDPSKPSVYFTPCGVPRLKREDHVDFLKEHLQDARVIETFMPAQNPTGGFGGGHGHLSHCGDGWVKLNREMEVSECALAEKKTFVELPPDAPARAEGLATFVDGLPEYLSRCQTFEGGISGAPQTEAHGAYAFCALACLCILGPPHEMLLRYIDMPLLVSWLSSRQYAPEGGFSGRTNKLVDGCYSHWVGGCWPIVEATLSGTQSLRFPNGTSVEDIYSRGGLIRYILSCCQSALGGLRDKPSLHPDAYHSCYTLAGLSSAQYSNFFDHGAKLVSTYPLDFAFRWKSTLRSFRGQADRREDLYDAEDALRSIHPLYVIPWTAVEQTHSYCAAKAGF